MPHSDGYAPVPGPANRESFFDAQARNRRASRGFTALSALAIGLMGIPLSAVLSPLLYAAAAVGLDLVNFVVPTPDVFRPIAEAEPASGPAGPVPPEAVAAGVALLVVPGSLALLVTWLGLRRLFRRAGAGATVLALGARPPRPGDLEEQQLVNVVGELAAAAGVPAPGVVLLDSPVPNAAAVGSRLDDYTVVVTTGLLATLDREETQGVVGHVVGSVGNGDLRIGATILSVFQTLGLVGSVLRAPAERRPRATLRRVLRYVVRGGDAGELAELLARAGADDDPDYADEQPGTLKSIVTLPFLVAGGAFTVTSMIFGLLVVNPFLRRAWRARRHLADAAAVQLTRNPDGLARALAKLAERGGVVPGTEWTAHLFAVGDARPADDGSAPMRTFHPAVADRVDRLRAMGSSVDALPRVRYSAGQRALLALTLFVTAPCWLPVLGLMLASALVLTAVSLMIDSMFLAPMVLGVHVLLRNLAGG